MRYKWTIWLLMIILVSSFVNSAIDPALIFCRDVGYKTDFDRENGTYCIAPNGTECIIWEYFCKCENRNCWKHINPLNCNLPCPEIQCKKEGEFNTIYECCEGLNQISCEKPLEDNSCPGPMVGPQCSICSDCGNNKCEEWENKCNCPEDCLELNFIKRIINWLTNLFRK